MRPWKVSVKFMKNSSKRTVQNYIAFFLLPLLSRFWFSLAIFWTKKRKTLLSMRLHMILVNCSTTLITWLIFQERFQLIVARIRSLTSFTKPWPRCGLQSTIQIMKTISVLVYQRASMAYAPYNKDWVKEKIYIMLRKQAGLWRAHITSYRKTLERPLLANIFDYFSDYWSLSVFLQFS